MLKKLTEKARSAADKLNLAAGLEAAKQTAMHNVAQGKASALELLERHWPKAEQLIVEGLLTLAEGSLKDDRVLTAIIEKAYDRLPFAARMVLAKDKFIQYANSKREPLLAKVKQYREREQRQGDKQDTSPEPVILEKKTLIP